MMKKLKATSLFDSLQQIPDPRLDRTKRHLLVDVLVIAVCAVLCGAESWAAHDLGPVFRDPQPRGHEVDDLPPLGAGTLHFPK